MKKLIGSLCVCPIMQRLRTKLTSPRGFSGFTDSVIEARCGNTCRCHGYYLYTCFLFMVLILFQTAGGKWDC